MSCLRRPTLANVRPLGSEDGEATSYTTATMEPGHVHYGALPAPIMGDKLETVAQLLSRHSTELAPLLKVSNNAFKQYCKVRPSVPRHKHAPFVFVVTHASAAHPSDKAGSIAPVGGSRAHAEHEQSSSTCALLCRCWRQATHIVRGSRGDPELPCLRHGMPGSPTHTPRYV